MESVLTNWWFIRAVKVTDCYFYTTELINILLFMQYVTISFFYISLDSSYSVSCNRYYVFFSIVKYL